MRKPVAEFWYAIECCEDGILRLREAWIDPYLAGNMWLMRGSQRDLLIDTGTGIASPRDMIDAISRRPVMAVACNRLYDHAGGLHAFDQRGCHGLDAQCIAAPTSISSAASIYVSDEMLMALPREGFRTSTYRMRAAAPTRCFDDGDTIDLGDRRLDVYHTPGITAGSMVLWEPATGSLFTCDTLYDDPVPERAFEAKDDPTAYVNSLKRIRELPVRTVYPGHFQRFGRDRMIEIIDGYLERAGR
jgi:glyoxylase-like metal-dependent hydrolase (beta-lactamase superfamily II)